MKDVEDKLAKLGYRLRPRTGLNEARQQPGHIGFDERGNAVYQWNSRHLTGDSKEAEEMRQRALSHEGLAIVEEQPRPGSPIQSNPKGLRNGYNPYHSGMLEKSRVDRERTPRKTNLRELSRWIEMKRKLEQKKTSDE